MADGTKCIDRGKCRGGKCIPFCETQDLQVSTILVLNTVVLQYHTAPICEQKYAIVV